MDEQAIHIALARSRFYQLLSVAFLYPGEEPLPLLKTKVEEIGSLLDGEEGIGGALQALATSLGGLSLEALEADYRRIFGHTISQECPPYETEYGSAHVFQQAQTLGDIAGFYRAFGLEMSDLARERPDHISVELEYMSFLAFKEAYALKHHGAEQAEVCREAQRAFLREHLGRWAPLFAKLLDKKAGSGFYQHLAFLTRDFLAQEHRRLEVTSQAFSEGDLKPVGFKAEGACFSCGIEEFCFVEPKEEG